MDCPNRCGAMVHDGPWYVCDVCAATVPEPSSPTPTPLITPRDEALLRSMERRLNALLWATASKEPTHD